MYLEHDATRLKSLVDRSALGVSTLSADDRERALNALKDIVFEHAVRQCDTGFAETFASLFLAAVKSKLDDA